MAKNKVKLAWIESDAAHRAALKKRRNGLLKKVQELSILCGVEACAVVYARQEQAPTAWPSPADAARMMARFRSLPEAERNRKTVSQEAFLRQRIAKLQQQLRLLQRENREVELAALMYEALRGRSLDDLRIEEASSLAWVVDNKLQAVSERRYELSKLMPTDAQAVAEAAATTVAMAPPASAAFPASLDLPYDGMEAGVAAQKPSWFVEKMKPWPAPPGVAGERLGDPAINSWASWPEILFH